jgi:hypothetical protein
VGMENAFTKTPAEALRQFQVTEDKGLSAQQVESLRQKHGRNCKLEHARRWTRGITARGVSTNTPHSAARRPAHAHLGAYPRAIQGPAGHHPARLSGGIIRTRTLRE